MTQYNDEHLVSFERAGKVTASLAGAILGWDPYTSWQEAWRKILGKSTTATSHHQQRGMDLEGEALEWFETDTGLLVHEAGFKNIGWLGATPDGITDEGLVEVKCPASCHIVIPPHYWAQCQIQMCVFERERCFFYSYTETKRRMWIVDRNKYFLSIAVPYLKDFYDEYVVKAIQPPKRKKGSRLDVGIIAVPDPCMES